MQGSNHEVSAKVAQIVINHLDINPDRVTPEAKFYEDLHCDSLDTVELTMAFEEEFDVEITDDEAEHVQTFGDAVGLISRKLASVEGDLPAR